MAEVNELRCPGCGERYVETALKFKVDVDYFYTWDDEKRAFVIVDVDPVKTFDERAWCSGCGAEIPADALEMIRNFIW